MSHERHGVSDHQLIKGLFSISFRLTSKKHQMSSLLVHRVGNPPVTGGSPHKGPVELPWTIEAKSEHMMTSSNGNVFRVTGPLFGEFTGHRWIPRTKAIDAELWCFLWSAPWINDWVNNREAGDLRRHHTHYDVIVMIFQQILS